jgi:hypothetical protein
LASVGIDKLPEVFTVNPLHFSLILIFESFREPYGFLGIPFERIAPYPSISFLHIVYLLLQFCTPEITFLECIPKKL